jgi:hypothetical protein
MTLFAIKRANLWLWGKETNKSLMPIKDKREGFFFLILTLKTRNIHLLFLQCHLSGISSFSLVKKKWDKDSWMWNYATSFTCTCTQQRAESGRDILHLNAYIRGEIILDFQKNQKLKQKKSWVSLSPLSSEGTYLRKRMFSTWLCTCFQLVLVKYSLNN